MTQTAHEISWDDESVKVAPRGSRDLEKFFLENNETARIVVLDENAFLAMTHYDPSVKRYVRCIKDVADTCPGCEKLGEPRQRFGANIVQYKSKKDGEVIEPIEWDIKLWTFGPDKFTQLRAIKKEWGDLRKVDLKVLCKDKQFQNQVITPLPKCLWIDPDKGIMKEVAEDFKENKYDVERLIGKQYSVEDMKKVLAGEDLNSTPDSAPPPEVIEAAVSDIEKELEAEASTESKSSGESMDFDELLSTFDS